MKNLKPALLLAPVLLAMMCLVTRASAGDDAVAQLNADYKGKVLMLRHFYSGKHLEFQADGSLAGRSEVGPWTVDGEILVQTIKSKGRTLQIRGRRVCLVFDSGKGPGRDVLELLAESTADDLEKREAAFRSRTVDIEVRLGADNPSAGELKTAMNVVFLTSSESMSDIVPDFWRGYFDKENGGLRKSGYSGVVYSIKKGEVSPPHQTYAPEPSFSEDARVAKYQGVTVLSVIVDPTGTTTDVAIVTPVGLGLDEKAVEAVRSWKFAPATKDGQPVAVAIMVEVDFHLY
jgi:TonB family protein